VVGEQLVGRLRDVFLAAVGADLSRLDDRARERVRDQAVRLTAPGATRALEVIGEAFVGIQDAPDPRIPLEVSLVRLTRDDAELSLAALADRVARLERGGAAPQVSGGTGSGPIDAGPAPGGDAERAAGKGVGAAVSTGRRGPRPADGAREALAQRRRAPQPQERPRPPAAAGSSARPAPARSPRDATPAPPSTPAPPAPPAPAGSPGGAVDDLPSRDELTLAWGDTILASLSNRARSRFAGGRFIAVEGGAAVFGLPNVHHARRCEEVREEVEQALASHFARPVPLRVVVDQGGATPSTGSAALSGPDPDEEVSLQDLGELTDATDVATSGLERIAEIFPGAELVDGGDT
jgi:hypothetical protein